MKRLFTLLCVLAAAGCSGVAHSSGSTLLPSLEGRPAVRAAESVRIVVDAAKRGPAVVRDVIGANLETFFDESQPHVWRSFAATGLHLTRWPGGSESDSYHWKTNSVCPAGGGYAYQQAQYDNFMNAVVLPAKLDVAITVNYGSNASCNGGGDPSEAADWVAESKAHHYPVVAWTVGNEEFGGWEFDLHPTPHDPGTYANAVTTGYYPAMKKADPHAKIGVIAAGSKFVELGPVRARPRKTRLRRTPLLPAEPRQREQFVLAGKRRFRLLERARKSAVRNDRCRRRAVGADHGRRDQLGVCQSRQADGLDRQRALDRHGRCGDDARRRAARDVVGGVHPNCSTGQQQLAWSLYGWQDFGSYNLFSDGPPASQDCNSGMGAGTPYPSGRAWRCSPGSSAKCGTMLAATSKNDAVRVYADATGGGYDVMLFNLSETAVETARVALAHAGKGRLRATQFTYGQSAIRPDAK